MVKKVDKREVPEFTRLVARTIKGMMAERGVTQSQVAEAIGRTQGYVSERVNGLDSWNTAEIEALAHIFGISGGMELMMEIGRRLAV